MDEPPSQYLMSPVDPLDTPRTKQLKDLRQKRLAYYNTPVSSTQNATPEQKKSSAKTQERLSAVLPKQQSRSPRLSSTLIGQRAPGPGNRSKELKQSVSASNNARQSLQKNNSEKASLTMSNVFIEDDSSVLDADSSLFTEPTVTDYTNFDDGNCRSHHQNGRTSDSNDLRLSLGSTILDTKNRAGVQKGVSGPNDMDLRLSLGSSITGTKAKKKNSDPEDLHLSLDSTVVQQNPWKKNGSAKYDLRSSIGSSTAVEETGNIFLKGGQNVDFGSSFDSTLVDTTPSGVADYPQRLIMQEQPTRNVAQLSLDSEVESDNTHPFAFNKFLMNSDQSDLRSSIESGTTAANTYFNSILKHDTFETSDTQNAEEGKVAVNKSVTFFLEEGEDENGNGEPAAARENQPDLVHQLMKDHQQKFEPNQFGLTDSMQSSLVTGVDNHSDVNFVKISKHFVNLDDSSIVTGTESEIQSSIAPPSYDQIHQQGVRVSGKSQPLFASQTKNVIPKTSSASQPILNSQNLKQNGSSTQVAVGSSQKEMDGHSSVLDTDISSVVGLDNQYKEGYIKGLRIALGEEKFQEMLDNSSELQEILSTLDKVAQVDGKPGQKKTTVEKQIPHKSSATQMCEDQGTVISDVLTDVTQDFRMRNQVPVNQGQEQVQFGNFDARINLPSDKTIHRAPPEMNNNVAWFKGQHSAQIAQPKPLRKSTQGSRSRDVDVPDKTHVGLNSQVHPDMRLNIMEEFEHIDPSVLSPTLSSPYSYRAEDRSKSRTGVLTMKAPPVQDGGQRTPRIKKCAFSAEEIYKQAFAEAENFLNDAKKTPEPPAPAPNTKHYPYGFREPTPPRKSRETPTHSHFHSRPVGPVPQKSGSETGRSSGPSEIIGTGPPKVLSQSDFESRSSDTGLSQEDHMKAVRDHHQYQRDAIIRQVTEQQKKPGYTSSSLDRYFSSLRDVNKDVAFDPIPEWSDVAPNRGGRSNRATEDVRLSHKVFSAIRESTPQSSLEDEVSGDYENYFLQVVRKSLQDSSVFLDDRSMDQFLSNIRGKSDNVDDFMRNLQQSLDSDRFQELVMKSGEFESESDGTKMAASSESDVSKVNKMRQSQKSLGKSTDYDGETLYTSVSGVTDKFDRLHLDRMLVRDELIGDQSKLNVLQPVRQGNSETEQMAFDGENGQRMVVVCPDCATLNKQYVTWCLDCGCVLIGVDPVPLKPKRQSKRSKEKSQKPNSRPGSGTRSTNAARPGSAKANSRPASAKDVKSSRPGSAKKSTRREPEQLKSRKVSKSLGKSSDDNSNDSSSGSGQDKKKKVVEKSSISPSPLRKSKELYRSNSKEATSKVGHSGSIQNGILKPVPQHKPVLHDQVQQAIEILHHGMESPKARHSNLKNELSLQLSMSSSMDTGLNGENGKVHGLKKGNPLGASISSDFQEVEIFERKMDIDLRRQSRQDAEVPTINLANLSDEEKPVGDANVGGNIPNFIALDDDSTIVDEEDMSTLADVSTVTDRIEDQRHLDQNVPDEELSHQEFLARIQRDGRVKKVPVPTPSSSNANNSRPKSAGKYRTAASMVDPPKGRPVSASKVRTSIEVDPYKRHWDRSSTAWGSFAANELNTWSSTNASNLPPKKRPISAKTRKPGVGDKTLADEHRKTTRPASAGQRARPTLAGDQRNTRPSSGPSQKIMSRMAERLAELNSDPLTRPQVVEAWTAAEQPVVVKPKVPHVYHNAEPMTSETYVHHIAMSPRVARGMVSFLLCLPDELLLHILSYLNHQDLTRVARTCSQMYRITQDETLWKHIMIRNKSNLHDDHLDEIGSRSPLSICLIQCLGDNITSRGLRNLFRHCADTLQELNIMGCSRGELTGDNIIFHAAAKCQNLTHVDMSWTNVNDTVLISMANCSRRLVSLNISGCQAITDDGLIGVVKKHGDSLRSIEAFGCFNITPKGIKALGQYCRKLVTLNIGQCYKVTDASVSQLASSLEKVKHLDFRGCKQVKDSCMRKIVRSCKNLESITLANCPGATDLSLVEIATYLPSIRYVDMSGCKLVTDVGMRSIAHNCYLVEHLDLSSTGVTNKSVSLLASYCSQRLQVLKLNFCKDITEQGLVKLARNCKRLKLMHLYGCKNIRNLDRILMENKDLIIERDATE
ncbi:uncharacterized protein LOC135492433 [Lineus longissimus]|uniref:uncharacterized protein LOC135492433 n=1 Tax=Lineus longissimus TaxID=88925 RepID=UPI002B4D3BF3